MKVIVWWGQGFNSHIYQAISIYIILLYSYLKLQCYLQLHSTFTMYTMYTTSSSSIQGTYTNLVLYICNVVRFLLHCLLLIDWYCYVMHSYSLWSTNGMMHVHEVLVNIKQDNLQSNTFLAVISSLNLAFDVDFPSRVLKSMYRYLPSEWQNFEL